MITAYVAGWLAERGWDSSVWRTGLAALLAAALMYVPGLLWLGTIAGFGPSSSRSGSTLSSPAI